MIPLGLLVCYVLVLVGGLLRSHYIMRSLMRLSWEDLLDRLSPVRADGIEALICHTAGAEGSHLSVSAMLNMVGGLEGLRRMRANADVLIALAAYAEQWNPEGGRVAAGQLRRDGLRLRRAVLRCRISLLNRYSKEFAQVYLRKTAESYSSMVSTSLSLYKVSHRGRYSVLLTACSIT